MLQLSSTLLQKSVLSLRTGTAVAQLNGPIINPNNLKIEGFYCEDSSSHEQLVLLYQDIRDMLPQGFVINDYDVLTPASDLVRLEDIMKLNFELLGKQVETVGHDKVGKVSDYATEIETMFVQKLYVSQSVFKNFSGGSLSVDRSQVQEITNKRIIIQDLLQGTPARAGALA